MFGTNIPSHRIHVLRVYLHFGTKLMGQMRVDIFRSPMDTLKIFMHLKIGFECPFPHDHLLSETFQLQKENQAQSKSKNFTCVPLYLEFPEQSSNSMRTVSTTCGANIKKWHVKGVILRSVKSHYMNLTCHILV